MAKCNFCGLDKKLSREHIWSSIVLRLFDPVAPLTIDEHRGIAHQGDPLVKDLCGDCNSLMSPVDTAMGAFAEKYLVGSLTDHPKVEIAEPNILRWVMKTVSNHERSLKAGTTWWQRYVGFFCGQGGDTSQVDVLLAPWEDLSPGGVATSLLGILTLGAQEMHFMGLRKCDVKAAY